MKVECVHGNDLKIDGWEREITVAPVPDVAIDVVLAWSAQQQSLVTTRAQRRRQLQETVQDEVEAAPHS